VCVWWWWGELAACLRDNVLEKGIGKIAAIDLLDGTEEKLVKSK